MGSFPSGDSGDSTDWVTGWRGMNFRRGAAAPGVASHTLKRSQETAIQQLKRAAPGRAKLSLPTDVRERSGEPEPGFAALLWLEESTAAPCPRQDTACPLATWFCNRWAQRMGNRLQSFAGLWPTRTPNPWKQLHRGSHYELCSVTDLCAGSKDGGVNNH